MPVKHLSRSVLLLFESFRFIHLLVVISACTEYLLICETNLSPPPFPLFPKNNSRTSTKTPIQRHLPHRITTLQQPTPTLPLLLRTYPSPTSRIHLFLLGTIAMSPKMPNKHRTWIPYRHSTPLCRGAVAHG